MRASADFERVSSEERLALLGWLHARLGIEPASLAGYDLWNRPGVPSRWIAAAGIELPEGLDPETVGILLCRDPPPRGYPSTGFVQRFGHLAQRQVLDVDEAATLALISGEALPLAGLRAPDELEEGLLVLRGPLTALGRGWLRDGLVRLDLPKNRRLRL